MWYNTLGFLVLWEANFHRPNYDLVPLGEYIYLGGNIKLRTAIKTAGILLPVFLSGQLQCWWRERLFFFPFPNFPLPTLAFQWWPSVCAAPFTAVVEMWCENCCVLCGSWDSGAGRGWCWRGLSSSCIAFWMETDFLEEKRSVSQQCLSLVQQNIWS